MRKLRVVIITAALVSTASVTGDRQDATETAIRAVHLQMRQAAEKLDAEALYAYVLDSPTPPIIENGRTSSTRADALRNTTSGLQAMTSVSYSYAKEHMTVLSPSTVLWVAEGTVSATLKGGRPVSAPFAETIVFVQRDGQWKVLHAHRSSPPR